MLGNSQAFADASPDLADDMYRRMLSPVVAFQSTLSSRLTAAASASGSAEPHMPFPAPPDPVGQHVLACIGPLGRTIIDTVLMPKFAAMHASSVSEAMAFTQNKARADSSWGDGGPKITPSAPTRSEIMLAALCIISTFLCVLIILAPSSLSSALVAFHPALHSPSSATLECDGVPSVVVCC
jgi:hypothetical protein